MAEGSSAAPRNPARVQVSSNKQPGGQGKGAGFGKGISFYLNLCKRIMNDHGEVQLSALGLAISNMVTVAEILRKEGWGVQKSLVTSLETLSDREGEGTKHKTKMEITLVKAPEFDQLYAAQQAAAAAAAPAEVHDEDA